MFKKNWKTTLAGFGSLITGIASVVTGDLHTGVAAILSGIGLIVAKDAGSNLNERP